MDGEIPFMDGISPSMGGFPGMNCPWADFPVHGRNRPAGIPSMDGFPTDGFWRRTDMDGVPNPPCYQPFVLWLKDHLLDYGFWGLLVDVC